ncbi:MAG TPA: GH32 C-terminal domain-containing protein, partial [Armatimonadota bacterium]
IPAAFTQRQALNATPVLGQWQVQENTLAAQAVGRMSMLTLGEMPDECLLETTITYTPGTQSCGLLLRADGALDRYYQVRLEPANQRLVIDRWPRKGDEPFMLERPLAMAPGEAISLQLLVDGTNLVVYADNRVALSCRMYDHRDGNLGVFVNEGEATFAEVSMRVRATEA